jgi:Tol biopolymer transport system component
LYCHEKNIVLLLALSLSAASLFCDDRHIAFERDQAVWIPNLDGTSEKKIADGIFPAISPDGTRIAFNTRRKRATRHTRVISPSSTLPRGKLTFSKMYRAITPNTRRGQPTGNIQKENERQPSIYRMSLDGKNPKLLMKHARSPSVSAP